MDTPAAMASETPALRKLWLVILHSGSACTAQLCLLSHLSIFCAAAVGFLQLIHASSLCSCANDMTAKMRLRMEPAALLLSSPVVSNGKVSEPSCERGSASPWCFVIPYSQSLRKRIVYAIPPAVDRCVGLRNGDVGLDASVADVCLVIVFLESSSERAGAHFEDEAQQADGA